MNKVDNLHDTHKDNDKAKKTVYYILGILETLFTFRLIFKLLGANPKAVFVYIIGIIIYALIAYGIVALINIYKTPKGNEAK